ncbi:MAG: DUF2332 domain-containing protein [Terricaulis sp.]
MSLEAITRAIELQAQWSVAIGSPFMAALMREASRDCEAGGPVADLLRDWPGDPIADALPTRLGGALHAAVLQGRAPALAAEYPAARADWDVARVWPLARDFIATERVWVRDFLRSPPQTNETRRTIAFLPGFLELARAGPLHLLELGASAGLNTMWDRFRYATASWTWGAGNGPLIDTEWIGAAPTHLDAAPLVASRAACDQNPLDVRSADDVLRLRAFVWADQPERLARLEAAIAVARDADVRVERADAGAWLAEKLAPPLPVGTTVIYHSVAFQYFSAETKRAVRQAIEAAGARADDAHRLAWLRYEVNPVLEIDGPIDGMAVDLQTWPGGARRVIARTDGHARKVIAA